MKRRTIAVLIGGAASLGAGAWLWDRYQFSVLWPAKLQHELFGNTLVAADNLIGRERHFAYGQGFARWRYRVADGEPSLKRLCGNVQVEKCSLTRHRTIERGVDLYASLSDGVLTLQEWWS